MQSDFSFRVMALEFRLRDLYRPPGKILREAGIRNGMTVLDFGCGPGGFSLAAAQLAGPEGRIYAVDHHPLAVKSVQKAARERGFRNIHMIPGGSLIDFPGESVDITLLYDVLHDLHEPGLILTELHRILKPGGALSVSDHHMKKKDLLSMITGGGLFLHAGDNRWTCQFKKSASSGAVS